MNREGTGKLIGLMIIAEHGAHLGGGVIIFRIENPFYIYISAFK